jgi:hypothetical protein
MTTLFSRKLAGPLSARPLSGGLSFRLRWISMNARKKLGKQAPSNDAIASKLPAFIKHIDDNSCSIAVHAKPGAKVSLPDG